jgi:hypothetical protein
MLDCDFIRVPFVFAKNFDFALIEQVSDHLLRALRKSDGS